MNVATDVCFICFLGGHRSPNCQHQGRQVRDAAFAEWVLGNYNRLSAEQRAHLRSIGRLPLESSSRRRGRRETNRSAPSLRGCTRPRWSTRLKHRPIPNRWPRSTLCLHRRKRRKTRRGDGSDKVPPQEPDPEPCLHPDRKRAPTWAPSAHSVIKPRPIGLPKSVSLK